MINKFQHLIDTQRNEFLQLLQKSEELFYGTPGTWKTDPLEFELKEVANPICLIPYTVTKVHK